MEYRRFLILAILCCLISFCRGEAGMCPSNIKNGEVALRCSRQRGISCTYNCNPGCRRTLNISWLECGEGGKWRENTDILCTDCRPTTTTQSGLCPATIPGGYVSPVCRRTVYSNCEFTCNDGCNSSDRTVYCATGLYWSGGFCICHENDTLFDPVPPGGSAVVGGVVGGVLVLVIIVRVVVWIRCVRKKQTGTTQYASPQPAVYQSAPPARTPQNGRFDGFLSPTYMMTNQDTHYTPLQTQQNNEQSPYPELQPRSQYTNNSYAQEPPPYITVSKLEPPEPPPSYAEVTANPTDFNVTG